MIFAVSSDLSTIQKLASVVDAAMGLPDETSDRYSVPYMRADKMYVYDVNDGIAFITATDMGVSIEEWSPKWGDLEEVSEVSGKDEGPSQVADRVEVA